MDFKALIEEFLNGFKGDNPNYVICNKADFEIEKQLNLNQKGIYNEDSLKFELGIFLREKLDNDYVVEFERNVQCFKFNKSQAVKQELDIVVLKKDKDLSEKYSIELKFPRVKNYGHTDELRRFEEDEQCVNALRRFGRFNSACRLIMTDDPLYIQKPSSNKGRHIKDDNESIWEKYRADDFWKDLQGQTKYHLD